MVQVKRASVLLLPVMPPYFPTRLCLSCLSALNERTDCRSYNDQCGYSWHRASIVQQYLCRRSQLKTLSPRCVATPPLDNLQIQLICEFDEIWAFIGPVFENVNKKTLRKLPGLLSNFNVAF